MSEQATPGRWEERDGDPAPGTPLGRFRGRVGAMVRDDKRLRAWVVRQYHRLYYDEDVRTWRNTYWHGVPIAKTPLDLWVYQELIHRLAPDLIVETGTFSGGSALYFGHLLDLNGSGRVISIDLDSETSYPEHDRVTYLTGSSTDEAVVDRVREAAGGSDTVMVVLDSDHSESHVSRELAAYHDLVTPGSYLVVEDTNVNGHPVEPRFGPGPYEAVESFLRTHHDFARDPDCEKYFMTFNPGGWLRRETP